MLLSFLLLSLVLGLTCEGGVITAPPLERAGRLLTKPRLVLGGGHCRIGTRRAVRCQVSNNCNWNINWLGTLLLYKLTCDKLCYSVFLYPSPYEVALNHINSRFPPAPPPWSWRRPGACRPGWRGCQRDAASTFTRERILRWVGVMVQFKLLS